MGSATFKINSNIIPKAQPNETPAIYSLGGGLSGPTLNLKIDESLDYDQKIYQEMKLLDKATIASLIATVSYQEYQPIRKELSKPEASWFDLTNSHKDFFVKDDINSYFRKKLFYNLKNLKVFSFDLQQINLPNEGKAKSHQSLTLHDIKYLTTSHGEYLAQDGLASAWVGIMPDPDHPGKNKLIISFRGTEFSNLKNYIFCAYANMSWHYMQFKPLIKAIINYADDPVNNISGIMATGHSLGGAMVQEFLRDYPETLPKTTNSISIEGYTFGSPGSVKKGIYRFMAAGSQLMQKLLAKKIQPTIDLLSSIAEPVSQLIKSKKLKYFYLLINFFSDKLYYKPKYKPAPAQDHRLVEFFHYADAVPKLGDLGYRKFGNNFLLFDESYEYFSSRRQNTFFSFKNFSIKKHAMNSYYNILESSLFKRADILNIGILSNLDNSGNLTGLSAIKKSIHAFNIESLVSQRINKFFKIRKFAKLTSSQKRAIAMIKNKTLQEENKFPEETNLTDKIKILRESQIPNKTKL